MRLTLNDIEYVVVKDYKNGFDKEQLENKFTDYFEPYDYIVGDWSYGKLRLKGFCKKGNKIFNEINNYNNVDDYLKKECAFDCKYFIVEKNEKDR